MTIKCPKCKHSFNPHDYDIPDWLDQEAWSAWAEHKGRVNKKTGFTKRMQKIHLKTLEGYKKDGYDTTEIINHSINGGWFDLYVPKSAEAKAIIAREQKHEREKRARAIPRRVGLLPDAALKIRQLKSQQFDLGRQLSRASSNGKLQIKKQLTDIKEEIRCINDGVVKLGDVKK